MLNQESDEIFPDHELVYVKVGETTKVCPKCGCTNMVYFQTMERKVCSNCPTQIYWGRDYGQPQLNGNNRQVEVV